MFINSASEDGMKEKEVVCHVSKYNELTEI